MDIALFFWTWLENHNKKNPHFFHSLFSSLNLSIANVKVVPSLKVIQYFLIIFNELLNLLSQWARKKNILFLDLWYLFIFYLQLTRVGIWTYSPFSVWVFPSSLSVLSSSCWLLFWLDGKWTGSSNENSLNSRQWNPPTRIVPAQRTPLRSPQTELNFVFSH